MSSRIPQSPRSMAREIADSTVMSVYAAIMVIAMVMQVALIALAVALDISIAMWLLGHAGISVGAGLTSAYVTGWAMFIARVNA